MKKLYRVKNANAPANVEVRADLINYAHSIMQDTARMRAIGELFAPIVPTGAASGLYNKFDTTAAFKAWGSAVSRRAIGGHSSAITLLSDTANYNVAPYGLRISVDQFERTQAANNMALLEQAKTRILTIQSMLSWLNDTITAVNASVSVTAGKGEWSNPNVNPAEEIDTLMLNVRDALGLVPNTVVLDFGAWVKCRNNPNIQKLFSGVTANITPTAVQGIFANPEVRLEIVDIAKLTGGGMGNSSATRTGVIGSSCYVFYSSPTATPYDPSFAKTFAETANMFTEVYTYREEPHLDWYENNWACQPVVIASGLCKRITVS